ncbi:MAG: PAS domain-containing protein, partial [Henriciella sp.]|nr:PAS domain-containing protein [Henriciella sp.]
SMPRLAWIADGDVSIYWYNRHWFEYTGTTLEEMSGWGWQSVHHPDHVDRVVTRIKKAFETGEPWEDLFPLRGQDGDYRWFLSEAQPLLDETGKVRFWFGTNMDVTEQISDAIGSVTDQPPEDLLHRIEIKPGATIAIELADQNLPLAGESPARQTILILEDEPMTALDLEMRLSDAGYNVMGPAMTIAGAEREIEHALPDIALLDSNLGGRKSYGLAERLIKAGVPVVFCTGYEELEDLPERLRSCPVVSKPFKDSVLMGSISAAATRPDA